MADAAAGPEIRAEIAGDTLELLDTGKARLRALLDPIARAKQQRSNC